MKKFLLFLSLMMLCAVGTVHAQTVDDLAVCENSYVLVAEDYASLGSNFGDGFFLYFGGTTSTSDNKESVDLSKVDTFGDNGEPLYVTQDIVNKYAYFGSHLNYLRLKNAQDVIAMKPVAGSKLIIFYHGNNTEGIAARIPKFSKMRRLEEPLNEAPTEETGKTGKRCRYDFTVPDDWTAGDVLYIGSYNNDIFISYIIVESAENVYLNPNVWSKDGARYAAYMFNDTGHEWIDFTDTNIEGETLYKATLPIGYDKFILVRMNGATTENNWDNKWNQTADIEKESVPYNAVFTINDMDGAYSMNTYPATIAAVSLKGATAWDDSNNWTEGAERDLVLTKTGHNTYTGVLNLKGVTGDYQFKLVANNGEADTWMGNKEVTLVDKPDWLSTVSSRTTGSNLLLKHSESGYRTYTVTATWEPNLHAGKNWSLKIEGKGLSDAPEYLINYPASTEGITLGDGAYYRTYWDEENTEKTYISLNDPGSIALTTGGGFKAGDKIIITPGFQYMTLYTLAPDNSRKEIRDWMSVGDNGFMLKKDYDQLFICSQWGSSPEIRGLVVERPLETPVIPVYSVVGDFADGEIEMEESAGAGTGDYYLSTVRNYVVTFDEGLASKTISFKAQRRTGDDVEELAEGSYTFTEEGKYVLYFAYGEGSVTLSASLQNADIASVQLFGGWNDWAEGLTMTKGEGDSYIGTLDLSETMDNQKFKLVVNDGDNNTYWLGNQQLTIDAPEGWVADAEDADGNLLLMNLHTGYKTYTVTATWVANPSADAQWTLKIEGNEERTRNDYVVTLKTNIPESEWPNVYVYAWSGESSDMLEPTGTWPGKEMEYMGDEDGNVAVFRYTISAYKAPDFVIFGDGTKENSIKGKNQSKDFTFEADKTYTWNEYAVTFATNMQWTDAFAYAWSGKGDDIVVISEEWPGTKMAAANGVFTYKFQAEAAPEEIIFSDGTKEGSTVGVNKTDDLDFVDGKVYELVEIGAIGYATFCSPYALDFEGTGIDAYIIKSADIHEDAGYVTLTPVKKAPANTGLIISGSTAVIPVIAASAAEDVAGNLLVACTDDTVVSSGYVLASSDSKAKLLKVGATTATVKGGHAYLNYNASGARELTIGFGEATGISSVTRDAVTANGCYNLAGQRVAQPQKGLYIVNGKKYVVK